MNIHILDSDITFLYEIKRQFNIYEPTWSIIPHSNYINFKKIAINPNASDFILNYDPTNFPLNEELEVNSTSVYHPKKLLQDFLLRKKEEQAEKNEGLIFHIEDLPLHRLSPIKAWIEFIKNKYATNTTLYTSKLKINIFHKNIDFKDTLKAWLKQDIRKYEKYYIIDLSEKNENNLVFPRLKESTYPLSELFTDLWLQMKININEIFYQSENNLFVFNLKDSDYQLISLKPKLLNTLLNNINTYLHSLDENIGILINLPLEKIEILQDFYKLIDHLILIPSLNVTERNNFYFKIKTLLEELPSFAITEELIPDKEVDKTFSY